MSIERSTEGLVSAIRKRLSLSGGVMTGFLTLHDDPVNDLHAVTKQYADALIGGGPAGPFVRSLVADTIVAVHTFNPAAPGAPFLLGANAQGQLVAGLNADLLDGQSGAFYLDRANHTGTQAPATISPQGSGSGLDADLLDGLHASAFQPIDAGLTALASLGAGIAVSNGADGWFARSIAVADTSTVDLTITDADGIAGNPTISASVVPGAFVNGTGAAGQVAFWSGATTIAGDAQLAYDATTDVLNVAGQLVVGTLAAPTNASAGIELNSTTKVLLLSRLTTAQKLALAFTTPGSLLFDSTLAKFQFIETPGVFRTPLVLEGRTGTTNNPVISSTSGGKVTGGNLGNLELQANPGLSSTAFVITNNPTLIDSAINTNISGTYNHMEIAATSFTLAGGQLRAIHYDPIITVIDDVSTVDIFRFQPQFVSAAGTSWALGIHAAIVSGQFYTPGAGSSFTGVVSRGLRYQPVFNNAGVGNVITSSYAVTASGTLSAAWSVTNTWALGLMSDPGVSGGLPRLGGLEINDLTSGTANFSIWSKGAGVFLAHAGAAVFGASQSTITAPTAGAIIDAFGNVLLNNTGTASELRLREPSAGGSSYTGFVAPALAANLIYTLPTVFPTTNGESLTSTTAGIMSWASMQPLDADLTAIAALTGTGLLVHTGAGTWAERTITAGAGISVTNGDGVSGNPTITATAPTIVTNLVTGSTSTIPNGSDLTANTVTTTPGTGTDVQFIASVYWDKTGATNKNVVMKLFKDGTEVNAADQYDHFNLAGSAATSFTTQTAHWVIASEAAGSHTYTLRLSEATGTANLARRIVSRLTVIY